MNFQPPIRRSRFAQLGHFVYRYRALTIAVWTLLMVVSLAVTPALEGALREARAAYEGESYRTEQFLKQELNVIPDALTLVFQQQHVQNSPEIELLLDRIRRLPSVRSVTDPADHRSTDGRTQYSLIQLQVSDRKVGDAIDTIDTILAQRNLSDLQTFLTGKPVVERATQQISKADLGRIELFVLPVTLIALVVVFGSAIAAAMPIAVGTIAVSVTFGILYLVTLKFDVSVFALNLTTMLGLGLGIDYALLIVNRFREELRSANVETAIAQTLETAGKAVFFSGLTVCIGLIAMMMLPILLLQSLGISGAIVVMLSVMAALTLLPALLGCVGRKILGRPLIGWAIQQNFWSAIAQFITHNSLIAVMLVLAIVAGLTSPFLSAQFGLGDADILPMSSSARQGIEVIQRSFSLGETSPIFLSLRTQTPNDRILSESHLKTLYDFVAQLKSDPRIAGVTSLVNLNPQFTLPNYQQLYGAGIPDANVALLKTIKQLSTDSTTLVIVKSHTLSHNPASRDLVNDLRHRTIKGLQIQVAGQTASEIDTIDAIVQRLPLVLLGMLSATFIRLQRK